MATRLSPGAPLADRLAYRRTIDDSGCWLWKGARSAAGYGQITVAGRRMYTHRASYELHVGAIADGMQLDHLCRVRHCFNPKHLEPVTNRDNTLRGECGRVNAERQLAKTACRSGHPYTEASVYLRHVGDRTYRDCRVCARERMRARRRELIGAPIIAPTTSTFRLTREPS